MQSSFLWSILCRYHSLYHFLSLAVTHCHLLSHVVIRCHSLPLDVPLVCLFINDLIETNYQASRIISTVEFFLKKIKNLFIRKSYCNSLKAHWQISKKRHFEKYCMPIFSFIGTPWRSYLENLIIEDKFIKKQVLLFMHQTIV